MTDRDGRAELAKMPRREDYVAGRSFDDAFSNDAEKARQPNPPQQPVAAPGEHFKSNHGGQPVSNGGEAA